MNKKQIKKEVKKLARQKKYEEIYHIYGPQWFRKYVSKEYKEEDIYELEEKGRFIDIYTKYGEFKEIYTRIDIENELFRRNDTRKNIIKKRITSKQYLKSSFKTVSQKAVRNFKLFGFLYAFSATLLGLGEDILEEENFEKYREEIQGYQDEIKEYARQFDVSKQSNMEIIMRVMKDLNENIKGYGEPELDITGYLGLDAVDGGVGVCRNFASNIADKLNQINPQYNARVICMYLDSEELKISDIERKLVTDDGIVKIYDNVKEKYSADGVLETKTIYDNEITTIYEYEENKLAKKRIKTPNKTNEIYYDIYGNQYMEKEIKERKIDDKTSMEVVFINGVISDYTEYSEDYYMKIHYIEGKKSYEIVSRENEEKVIYYNTSGKTFYKHLEETFKDDHKISTLYDELGEEIFTLDEEEHIETQFSQMKENQNKTEKNNRLEKLNEQIDNASIEVLQKILNTNHAIVALDIDEDNVTLLIDPTNPSIGIFKDGKIITFNEPKESEGIYERGRIIAHTLYNGLEGIRTVYNRLYKKF